MKTKKNPNIDPEKYRLSFFLIGLAVVIGILLTAFKRQMPLKPSAVFNNPNEFNENDLIKITRWQEPPPKEKPPKKVIPKIIRISQSGNIIEDAFDISPKISETNLTNIEEPKEPIGTSTIVFKSVSKMPKYPVGNGKLMRDIVNQTRYPPPAAQNDIQETVMANIIINA